MLKSAVTSVEQTLKFLLTTLIRTFMEEKQTVDPNGSYHLVQEGLVRACYTTEN